MTYMTVDTEAVLRLIRSFLEVHGLHDVMLSLEKDAGLLPEYPADLLYLRDLVLSGNWNGLEEYLSHLNMTDGNKDIVYAIEKQKFVEILAARNTTKYDSEGNLSGRVGRGSTSSLIEQDYLKRLKSICPSTEEFRSLLEFTLKVRAGQQVGVSSTRLALFHEVGKRVADALYPGNTYFAARPINRARLVELLSKGLLYEKCESLVSAHMKERGYEEPEGIVDIQRCISGSLVEIRHRQLTALPVDVDVSKYGPCKYDMYHRLHHQNFSSPSSGGLTDVNMHRSDLAEERKDLAKFSSSSSNPVNVLLQNDNLLVNQRDPPTSSTTPSDTPTSENTTPTDAFNEPVVIRFNDIDHLHKTTALHSSGSDNLVKSSIPQTVFTTKQSNEPSSAPTPSHPHNLPTPSYPHKPPTPSHSHAPLTLSTPSLPHHPTAPTPPLTPPEAFAAEPLDADQQVQDLPATGPPPSSLLPSNTASQPLKLFNEGLQDGSSLTGSRSSFKIPATGTPDLITFQSVHAKVKPLTSVPLQHPRVVSLTTTDSRVETPVPPQVDGDGVTAEEGSPSHPSGMVTPPVMTQHTTPPVYSSTPKPTHSRLPASASLPPTSLLPTSPVPYTPGTHGLSDTPHIKGLTMRRVLEAEERLREEEQQNALQACLLPSLECIGSVTDKQVIRAISFSPTGRLVAIGANSRCLRICSADDLLNRTSNQSSVEVPLLYEHPSYHQGSIYSLAWSSQGLLASGSNDQVIRLLQFKESEDVPSSTPIDITSHRSTVRDLKFMDTNQLVSASGTDGAVKLTDCSTLQNLLTFKGHTDQVLSVEVSGKDTIISASQDRTINLMDVRSISSVGTFELASPPASLSLHGTLLSATTLDGHLFLYDTRMMSPDTLVSKIKLHAGECRSVHFSPDGQLLLTGSYDRTMRMTSVRQLKSAVVAEQKNKVVQCRWHPSGLMCGSTGVEGKAVFWKTVSGASTSI